MGHSSKCGEKSLVFRPLFFQRERSECTRNGCFAFTLMRDKGNIWKENKFIFGGRGAGVTPVFHYPCSQRIYLKRVAGVALCAIPTLDTPRGEACF